MIASSILTLFGLGGAAAAILGAASKVLHVEEDPRIAQVEGCFPGANCGGCGYPGCGAAAAAIVAGDAEPEICVAGGMEIAENIARILGVAVKWKEPLVAQNICTGGTRASMMFDYEGLSDCRAEALMYGGDKSCGLGCLGMGSCVKVCGFDAIELNEDRLPKVNMTLCRSCGKCAEVCPTGAIRITGLSIELLHLNKLDDCLAPCMQKCPAQIDVRTFMQHLKNGHLRMALSTIKERNPLPLSVNRVCPHGCEAICRRNIADEGVAINTLERYVADWEMQTGARVMLPCNPANGHKVAIIGGGPAGLSAAYFLRRVGYEPTIIEAQAELGGMLKYAIPEYRLPNKCVDWEVQGILELGVEARTSTEFGTDVTLESLKAEGFEAVLFSTGAWEVPAAGIPGEDAAEGIVKSIDFLTGIGTSVQNLDGRKVTIIGTGNTAMDVARSAVRLGAASVTVTAPCIRRKMDANKREIDRAVELGVDLRELVRVDEIVNENGAVSALKCVELQYKDPKKALGDPFPVEGSEFDLATDLVVIAMDRKPRADFVEAIEGLDIDKNGLLKADKNTQQTALPEVFVAGELFSGRSTVIQAVADGRRAARSIHEFIENGEVVQPGNTQQKVIPESILKNMDVTYSIPRVEVPQIPVEERKASFVEEVKLNITRREAHKECSRCLRCGLTCYDAEAGSEYAADEDVKPFNQ